MEKIKLGIIYGGVSTEHEVSVASAKSVVNNVNKDKYEIYKIFISKDGIWYENENKINSINEYLKKLDVVFPVLHGLYGEDGTIQGLLELLNVKYVGCKVLASSIAMDKVYTKIIFDKANIKQAEYVYIKVVNGKYELVDKEFNSKEYELEELVKQIEKSIKYPLFVKPSNSGSSVGISKVKNKNELKNAIIDAEKYDYKILIEENIEGKEIECAILGNNDVKASILGEIKPAEEFYSYDAKYNNTESKTLIPANISNELSNQVRDIAIKAFKAIDGKGFSRVDFFVNDETNEIIINEINTIPGFTEISMYPKLWEATGIKYQDLIDNLITLALE